MRQPLLVATVAVYALLAHSAEPARAETFPRDPGGLDSFSSTPREAVRVDPSLEPLVMVQSSTPPPRPEPEPWGETDPWADAMVGLATTSPRAHLSPYPLVMNDQVRFFVNRFTGERRDVVDLWLSRAGRYLGM